MDLVRDHVPNRGVHRAVARELVEAGEPRGNDEHAVVARAAPSPCVTRVAGALVLEGDVLRAESRTQPFEQPLLAGHAGTIAHRDGRAHVWTARRVGVHVMACT